MDYVLGVTTLEWSGDIIGTARRVFVPPTTTEFQSSEAGMQALTCQFVGTSVAAVGAITYGLNVSVGNGISGGTGQTSGTTIFIGGFGTTQQDLSGSYLMTAEVEKFVTITEGATNPSYGGSAIYDAPSEATLSYQYRLFTGGSIHCEATWGALSASVGMSVGTANHHTVLTPTMTALARAQGNGAPVCAVRTDFLGAQFGVSFSHSAGSSSGNASYGAYVQGNGTVTLSGKRTLRYSLAGQVYRYNEAYSGTVHLKADKNASTLATDVYSDGSGMFTITGSQEAWTATANLEGSNTSDSRSELYPFSLWIDPSWLSSQGDDPGDWRIMQHGLGFDAFSLTHAGTQLLNDASYVGTGPTDIVRTFGTTILPQSYRYLGVRVDSTPVGGSYSLKIGSKEWTRDYTGAAVATGGTVIFDLCSPTNGTALSDSQDSIYPFPTPDGIYWGVTYMGTMTLSGLGTPVYEIKGIAGYRSATDVISFSPAFRQWDLAESVTAGDTTTETYYRRFAQADTDYRLSFEAPDFVKTVVITPSLTTTTYTPRTIADIINDFEQVGGHSYDSGGTLWPGWNSTIDTDIDVTDGTADSNFLYGYINKHRPATWIWGGGMYYGIMAPGTVRAWHHGHLLDIRAGTTVPAQMLYDHISWDSGFEEVDPFGHAGTPGSVLALAAGKSLRGAAWGITLGTTALPAGSIPMQVVETSGGASAGTALSDSQGGFNTGAPFGKGQIHHTIQSGTASFTATVGALFYRGKRHRAVLKGGAAQGEWLSLAVSRAHRFYRAYILGGVIYLGTTDNYAGAEWVDLNTGISGYRPSIDCDQHDKTARVVLVYEQNSGGPLVKRYTLDEGRTWSMAVTISATGKYGRFKIALERRTLYYWYDSGAIKGVIHDPFDNIIVAEFTVVASGANDTAFDVDASPVGQGAYRIRITYWSGSDLLTITSLDGVNFS